jgi:hypothetical protein
MSEQNGENLAPEQTQDLQGQEISKEQGLDQPKKDFVKYSSYRDAVGRAKKYQERLETLEQELESERQNKLAAEGKKDELIESLRKQNAELNDKYRGAVGTFAETKAYEVITDEATKMGCASTSLLRRAVADKIKALEFGDDFVPNRDQVRAILQDLRNEEPILFAKSAPNVGSHSLKPGEVPAQKKKSVRDMTKDELMEMWAKG